jgi:hypothetical protein
MEADVLSCDVKGKGEVRLAAERDLVPDRHRELLLVEDLGLHCERLVKLLTEGAKGVVEIVDKGSEGQLVFHGLFFRRPDLSAFGPVCIRPDSRHPPKLSRNLERLDPRFGLVLDVMESSPERRVHGREELEQRERLLERLLIAGERRLDAWRGEKLLEVVEEGRRLFHLERFGVGIDSTDVGGGEESAFVGELVGVEGAKVLEVSDEEILGLDDVRGDGGNGEEFRSKVGGAVFDLPIDKEVEVNEAVEDLAKRVGWWGRGERKSADASDSLQRNEDSTTRLTELQSGSLIHHRELRQQLGHLLPRLLPQLRMVHQQPVRPRQLVRLGFRFPRDRPHSASELVQPSLLPLFERIGRRRPLLHQHVGENGAEECRVLVRKAREDGAGAQVEEESDEGGGNAFAEGVVGSSKGDAEVDLSESMGDVEDSSDVWRRFDDLTTLGVKPLRQLPPILVAHPRRISQLDHDILPRMLFVVPEHDRERHLPHPSIRSEDYSSRLATRLGVEVDGRLWEGSLFG